MVKIKSVVQNDRSGMIRIVIAVMLNVNASDNDMIITACHSCPEFKSSDCTIFKKCLRCIKSKVWHHDSYCLPAHLACNRSFLALQGRMIDKIRLDGDYADPNEDNTKDQTYGVHLLHRLKVFNVFLYGDLMILFVKICIA
ncbi:hypothetical protein X798_03137 [Onchocerca flexuosa]|uniref:Uncharacterized protein n=1 Tax=Onchocerca flexuosa TaxID=387005 RepID=A0A238BXG3_9BILA|nr:hypothetical protein X798_03137 [Onchocerca flexuosa]